MKLYGRPGELYIVVVNEIFLGHRDHGLLSEMAREGDMLLILSCVWNEGLKCLLINHRRKSIICIPESRLRDLVEYHLAKEVYR